MKNGVQFKLKNGIKVVCINQPNFAKTSVRIKIFAGSLHEEKPGVAHFFEHIIFQGTKDFPSEKLLDEFCDKNAIFKNAKTTKMDTVFMTDGIDLEPTVRIATQLAFFPKLTEESLNNELNAVLEEARGVQFSPGIKAKLKQAREFGGAKYAELITGTVEQIAEISHQDLIKFHKRHYQPENTLIVITSNRSIEDQKHALEAEISDIKAGMKSSEPVKSGIQFLKNKKLWNLENNELDPQSLTYIAYEYAVDTPKSYSEWLHATTVSIILSKAANELLRKDRHLVYHAWARYFFMRNRNFNIDEKFAAQTIGTGCSASSAKKVIELLPKVFDYAINTPGLIESVVKGAEYEAAAAFEYGSSQVADYAVDGVEVYFDQQYSADRFIKAVRSESIENLKKRVRSIQPNLKMIEITSPDQELLDHIKQSK